MVHAPGFLTFAGHEDFMLCSRSVPVIVSLSSEASIKKFERMGIVVLRSTTLCVAVSSRSNSCRLTLISMAPCAVCFSCSTPTPGILCPPLGICHTLHHRAQKKEARSPLGFILVRNRQLVPAENVA